MIAQRLLETPAIQVFRRLCPDTRGISIDGNGL